MKSTKGEVLQEGAVDIVEANSLPVFIGERAIRLESRCLGYATEK